MMAGESVAADGDLFPCLMCNANISEAKMAVSARNQTGGWIPLRGDHFRGCWAVDALMGKV